MDRNVSQLNPTLTYRQTILSVYDQTVYFCVQARDILTASPLTVKRLRTSVDVTALESTRSTCVERSGMSTVTC